MYSILVSLMLFYVLILVSLMLFYVFDTGVVDVVLCFRY